jgi:hypothetical protein
MVAMLAMLAMLGGAGCSAPEPNPAYGPYRTLLEVVAELDATRDADFYRFDPPRDVSGESLPRATLARLERIESLLRDPALAPAIVFARAQAHERLSGFEAALAGYREVAAGEGPLAAVAAAALPFTAEMVELTRPLPDPVRPLDVLAPLAQRREALTQLLEVHADDPRVCLTWIAIERLDVRLREYLYRNRNAIDDGTRRAVDHARDVIAAHSESRRLLEHVLRLGDFLAELARAQVAAIDPESAEFDATRARNAIAAAAEVYAEVAAVDGAPEREEARAGLAALEALAQRLTGTPP